MPVEIVLKVDGKNGIIHISCSKAIDNDYQVALALDKALAFVKDKIAKKEEGLKGKPGGKTREKVLN